jgi:thioredoxin-related protein
MTRLATLTLIASSLVSRALAEDPVPEVQWRSDYSKARQEAVEKGRLLVLDIGTENCFYCKQLDLRTFRDPAVVAFLNERCVPLKIDANQNAKLAADLRVDTYPTLVFAGSDGRILGSQVGFVEAPAMLDLLQRAQVHAGATPEWMTRDVEEAAKAVGRSDYPRAVALLKNVLEDGRERPVQVQARKLLQEIEEQAAGRCARARDLMEEGKAAEAIDLVAEVLRQFPGTKAARESTRTLVALARRPTSAADTGASRAQAARDLLNQARENYDHKEFLRCLDRCEMLLANYPDLPEAAEAGKLAADLRSNPEITSLICEQMGERLSVLYLSMAEAWLKKGQPQQAVFYLERVMQTCPNSRHAELAQVRLAQIQGAPLRVIEAKKHD